MDPAAVPGRPLPWQRKFADPWDHGDIPFLWPSTAFMKAPTTARRVEIGDRVYDDLDDRPRTVIRIVGDQVYLNNGSVLSLAQCAPILLNPGQSSPGGGRGPRLRRSSDG